MVDLIEKPSYKPKIKVQNEKVTTFTDRSSDESSSESSSVSSDESSDESSKENLKQKTTQLRQVQEPKFLNNKTQRAETILITKEKKPTVITKPQGIKTKPQENRLVKPDKKEEEELLPVKKYKPKEQTQSKYSKEKTQQITKQAFDKQLPDELNPEELKAFIQIPSGKLEDVRYLKDNFPDLFTIGTEIIFRVYEMTSSGAGVSKYKYGRIEEFSESSNSFLINLTKGNDDSLHMMYDINLDLICVPIKDFVELRIKVDSNQENKKETHREETTADVLVSSQPSTVDKSVITPFIKKQVEFYFSDKNYYKDSFLLEKAKQDGNKCKTLIFN